ncbi:MAG: VTT domain-containing protein [Alphaproteobacteria bacterium]|uniref:TVP38/TMEM64 family protein n=1 Tax=Brevundimonas sp. TaxID=1871086 RepID=UPI00178F4D05|nr:VTT domain-containing protein [Brevundimonas sp.]MBU3970657.1 VTT domain-containing protein [Alphaproteobacteria bacterium]MBA3051107.1 TVP38/TMEM64 family protein [Brevundimonas sp.]MBU3972988.1 VTT domain-containing protein [Alphaproteobacteria bacterium]MBU4040754.1 VTT domain-containing protein [Alphaproteobacteria bacterium]MBU4136762.1 VTT domain-containing protein [Alphaproteobacteria bacterium]
MDRIKRFLPLILLAGVIVLIFATGWNRYLSLDTIRDHGADFHAFKDANYLLCLLILMAVFATLTASVVPGVFFVTITAGYLFGPWVGGVSTAIAATVGALIVYAVARSALGEALRRKAARDKGVMQKVCDAIDRDTFWYVLASRLAVVVPFHMINVAAGIMAVRLTPYTVATVIGLLPAHIIYCWIGARLNELLQTNPDPDFQALFGQFWAPMAGVFILAVVLPFALKGLQAALGRKASA